MKILFAFALFVSLAACGKKDDDPAAPVVNYFKSVTARDSAGVMNNLSSNLREAFLSSKDSTQNMRALLDMWKGNKVEVAVINVKRDNDMPNTAKVYLSTKSSAKDGIDSSYYLVVKEDNEWRLSTLKRFKP